MAGLHLYRSNRLENLAAALAEVLANPVGGPLEPELVVVQSLGMRRWLSLELARALGVTMNVAFPFPAEFVQRVFTAAFPGHRHERGLDRAVLPWRIMKLLPKLRGRAFEELRRYLAGEMSALKTYQLAMKIAGVFDRYLAYRPELILEWQQGRDDSWTARLWRELIRDHERAHPPALAQQLSQSATRLEALPARVAVFGITSLPPFHLHLLGEVAARLDVYFFQLDPTDLYWGDLLSQKEQERFLRRQRKRDLTPEALHLETGHSLLASMGKVGREFSKLLLDLAPSSEVELFAPPARTTLLHQVQVNIFELCERATPEKTMIPADDRSIQIHCCHSPMRELEVLHDQLLALFENDPALTPRDILVTMPDVEAYAPFIEAVFGAPERPELHIPFSIADRSGRAENSLAAAFLRLLDLAGSRFGAGSVLALLETPAIQRRFQLASADLDSIRTWVERAGIRWGIDAAHRAEQGVPAFAENSWRAGLRRLLLGYALPGDGGTLFENVLPVREIEGGLATVLGNFVEFAEALFAMHAGLGAPRSLTAWARVLRETFDTFFDDSDESADEIRHLRGTLESFASLEREAECDLKIEFEVIRAHLAATLAETDSGAGFLAGRVTFCALKPMRSIPFKVICLLGMNDTAFPRRDTALAFDLVATQPRAGDRSLRDDDRQLFLESVLSARDTLYISYCGRSPRDASVSPPSVLVSELLDHLAENFAAGALVTQHPLQPFSARYFSGEDTRLFTYSGENARAQAVAAAPRELAAPFISSALPEPGPEWREVTLDQLGKFFTNPAKFFLKHRLQVSLPEEAGVLEEREPTALEGLARYAIESEVVRKHLGEADPDKLLGVLRAGGELPPGFIGEAAFRQTLDRVRVLIERLREPLATPALPPLPIVLELDGFRISGIIEPLHEAALVCFRPAKLKAKDRLRAWIAHLAMNAAAHCDADLQSARASEARRAVRAQQGRLQVRPTTLLAGLDGCERFRAPDDAAGLLRDLLAHYTAGLREPLRFYPESSWEFARRREGAGKTDPRKAARDVFDGGDFTKGERTEPHVALCIRGLAEPLDATWEQLAQSICGPMLTHLA